MEAFKKKLNHCSKSSLPSLWQILPSEGLQNMWWEYAYTYVGSSLLSTLSFPWEETDEHNSFFPLWKKNGWVSHSSPGKFRISFCEAQSHGLMEAFKRDWGNPRSQSCCWCFEKSLAALPQAVLLLCCSKSFLGLFSELEELLFFSNQEKQIPCVLLEGPCTEKKANKNTNGSRSSSPKHVKQCFKRYQQTVAAGNYSIKKLLHLCKIFMCIWNEVVPHNEE